ncbi:hypothetical protein RvY_07057 [Ramazzottius varieornatus]|uniref:poly(A)-specific ribonuclease n=1 Tax=Ramazzottius varieornatus TaxID=947166 RepID=A0A1D1V0R3_RAMVA|nr:hypothetical protein RvY_07057 [Ramazzottius varieornatus]
MYAAYEYHHNTNLSLQHDHNQQLSSSSEIEAEIYNAAPVGNDSNARSSRGNENSRHRSQGHNGSASRRNAPSQSHTPSAEERARAGVGSNGVVSWDVLEITGGVRNMSRSLFAMTHLGALYMANNQISRIPAGIARLRNLTILDLSNNRLRVLPPEIGVLLQLKHLYLQQNFLRTLPFEIGRLYKLSTLALDGNPLLNEIFEVYQEYGLEKFLVFLLEQLNFDSPPPPNRTMVTSSEDSTFSPYHEGRLRITVLCYNVLCGQYCSRAQYGYCPQWALEWDYRRKGIMTEINRHNSDLICLQEVETEQYYSFFVPKLRQHGIEGCFVPKSRAKTMHNLERSHVDGCAIFYNTAKFEFIEDYSIEFSHLAMSYAHSDGCVSEASENMLNRVMPKDNVGLVALLRIKNSSGPSTDHPAENGTEENGEKKTQDQYILVVNVHVHWDPEYCDVKLIQCIMLSSRLRDIANNVSKRYYGLTTPDPTKVPIIFTGDMNSLPDSGVLEFFLKGEIPYTHKDFRGIQYKPCIARYSAVDKDLDYISHGLQMGNPYQNVPLHHTNYTLDFKGVIDYILYSRAHFNCLGVLNALSKDWLEDSRIVGFPHPHIPSDHIPIVAEFELVSGSKVTSTTRTNDQQCTPERNHGFSGFRNGFDIIRSPSKTVVQNGQAH